MGSTPTRYSIGESCIGKGCSAPSTPQLLPVRVAEVVSEDRPPARLCAGVIVVEVGRARLRIEGTVDAEALRLVLERVGR